MKILELWRYPVKSMAGERISTTSVGERGVAGDRAFALRQDDNTRNAKKFPGLMGLSARYDTEPEIDRVPAPLITFDDGSSLYADDPAASARVSDFVGATISISALAPATDSEFYRRRERRTLEESRAILGLVDGEPLPDLSGFPPKLAEFSTPPGTFFDCFPILVLTTSSLRALQAAAPESAIDVRRFRPNILLDTDEDGFIENAWGGRKLRIGSTTFSLTLPCPRCVMTTIGFHDLPRDTGIMRSLVRATGQSFGIYAEVEQAGTIKEGDEAVLV